MSRFIFPKLLPALLLSLSLLGACSSGPRVIQPTDRQARALAMWQERCKTSGEKIYKTVEGVEGIYLMKLRPDGINYGDQFKLDDPYGSDLLGNGYIVSFLRGSFEANIRRSENAPPVPKGYSFVEAQDPKDGQQYRYTGSKKAVRQMDASAPNVQVDLKRDPNFDLNIYEFVLDRVPFTGTAPRYGITYDDISTREEREYWIAGSSLKVVDLQTNAVIAERIGYMVDWGQGDKSGGRSPWPFAANNACPAFASSHGASAQSRQAQRFVEKVLKPSK